VEPGVAQGSNAPKLSDGDYLHRTFGFGTLDDLAQVLFERSFDADDSIADVTEIKRRMVAYGPQVLWETVVGPMLDHLEGALALDQKRPG